MWRILTLLCILALASVAKADPPNVLLIIADDMGYGDLGCYESKQIETPNLDQLAAHGIRLTDGYVAASVCAPSRAGLLTGRYPQNFGFESNLGSDRIDPELNGIPPGEKTMGDYLKAAGYCTGLVGK